ncbi:MAG: hypothetical protein IT161_10520 [Bryobacterales bacterium]|nr:hypothetical protein [Bryobacterales bacterium]
MKPAAILCLAALALPAGAQVTDPGGPRPIRLFPQLTDYLQLSGEQSIALFRLYSDWNQYLVEKRVRVAQVETELTDLTRQDVLDPMAFGNRYVELESICREAKDRRTQYRDKSRSLLNPTQSQKLQVLEQAFALAPVIQEAQDANLMGREVRMMAPPPPYFSSGPGSYGIMSNYFDPLPGCRTPGPRAIIIDTPLPMPRTQP